MQDTIMRWFVCLVRLDMKYFRKETDDLKCRYNGRSQKTGLEKPYQKGKSAEERGKEE